MVGPTGTSGGGNSTNGNSGSNGSVNGNNSNNGDSRSSGDNGASGGGITIPKAPASPQSIPTQFEGQAVANSAGFALVAVGFFVAFFL
jgi:hypothetical protein